jgi:hypothetical protein
VDPSIAKRKAHFRWWNLLQFGQQIKINDGVICCATYLCPPSDLHCNRLWDIPPQIVDNYRKQIRKNQTYQPSFRMLEDRQRNPSFSYFYFSLRFEAP